MATLPAEQRDTERRRLSGRSRPTDGMTPEQAAEHQRVRRNEYQREWQKRHPGYSTDIMRRWRASHPAEYAVRKAKERGATEIELVPPLEVFERDEWMCHICGGHVEIEDVSLDHIVPIALGGGHTWANLACSHRACNFAKGHREPNLCPSCGEVTMAGAKRCRWCGFGL